MERTLRCNWKYIWFAVTTILVVAIVSLVLMYAETQAAIVQWERVGGGVSVKYNGLFGPDEMFIGTMPGTYTSSDLDAIQAAAIRLNRWPACRKLRLGDLNLSCEEYTQLLSGLRLEHLGLTATQIDLNCVTTIIEQCDVDDVAVGKHLSYSDVESLLKLFPKLRVSATRFRITDDEEATLQQEFGNRLSIYRPGDRGK